MRLLAPYSLMLAPGPVLGLLALRRLAVKAGG
jgi:hypothetical protein